MRTLPHPPRDRRDFYVAIICALDIEASAVLYTFQVDWSDRGHRYGRADGDNNSYTTGVVGGCNVVLAHMPGMGVTSASSVATNLRHSFPNIKIVLVVGICGGVPSAAHHKGDIFLGDLVIGTAVVPYDFGRQYPGFFEARNSLEDAPGRPDSRIRGLVAKLKTDHHHQRMRDALSATLTQVGLQKPEWIYPGLEKDILYESSYVHQHMHEEGNEVCGDCAMTGQACFYALHTPCHELRCDPDRRVNRPRNDRNTAGSVDRNQFCPEIHFGSIGSGGSVMKSGQHRDQIATTHKLIAFEMEGAGTWDSIPSIVVKGVCDYADSHKNKDWQSYAAVVAAISAQVILQELELDSSSHPSPAIQKETITPGKWVMPFERDLNFVPRGDVMSELDQCLETTSSSSRVVLTGLGGIGKSQIAIEYAYQLRERAPGTSILWVHASNSARFRASYQSIAHDLQLPGFDDPQIDQLDAVYRWLQNEESGRFLLIIDNVDDISQLHHQHNPSDSDFSIVRYLPQRAGASVLFTSRSHRVATALASRPDHVISVGFMSPDEAHQLARSKISSSNGNDVEIAALCQALDLLPLAITQAAAYIARSRRTTVAQYLQLLGSHENDAANLLSREATDLRRDWASSHSVMRTWQISFLQIKAESQLAADILSLMAVFDRQSVPDFLLRCDKSESEFDEAVDILLSHAFVQVDAAQTSFGTHRLVQLATRMWLKHSSSWEAWQERALESLNKQYPDGEYRSWTRCQMLEPHAESALLTSYKTEQCQLQLANVITRRATYHVLHGNHKITEVYIRKSLEIRSDILGSEHKHTLLSMHELARVLYIQGQYQTAEEMYRGLIETTKKTSGDEHPDTLTPMHSLAQVLFAQGQYQTAQAMLETVFNASKKHLGPEHQDTLISMHELARVLYVQGQFETAENMYREIITSMKTQLGEDHPDVLTSMHGLARVLDAQSQFEAAEEVCREVLKQRENTLGREHPNTLSTTWALADILYHVGSIEEALRLYQRAAAGFTALYGPTHPKSTGVQQQLDYVVQVHAYLLEDVKMEVV